MASAKPVGEVEGGELDDRPTLIQNQNSRGDRLASDDPSTPGPVRAELRAPLGPGPALGGSRWERRTPEKLQWWQRWDPQG